MSANVSWLGYEFTPYNFARVTWNEVPSLYIFAGLTKDLQGISVWRPFYIGQCQSFEGYIPTHRKWKEARRLGGTHVHAMVEESQESRDLIEAALIKNFQPRLNIRGK